VRGTDVLGAEVIDSDSRVPARGDGLQSQSAVGIQDQLRVVDDVKIALRDGRVFVTSESCGKRQLRVPERVTRVLSSSLLVCAVGDFRSYCWDPVSCDEEVRREAGFPVDKIVEVGDDVCFQRPSAVDVECLSNGTSVGQSCGTFGPVPDALGEAIFHSTVRPCWAGARTLSSMTHRCAVDGGCTAVCFDGEPEWEYRGEDTSCLYSNGLLACSSSSARSPCAPAQTVARCTVAAPVRTALGFEVWAVCREGFVRQVLDFGEIESDDTYDDFRRLVSSSGPIRSFYTEFGRVCLDTLRSGIVCNY